MTDTTRRAPQPKPGILDIAAYVGGKGSIVGVADPIKLSSNENPLGAGPKAREAFASVLDKIHIYPDGRADKLRAAVAAKFGLEEDRLLFGNGSDEVFALLNQTYLTAGDNIVSGEYGFLAYRISAQGCEAEVKLVAEPNYKAEVADILAAVDERTKIVYLSNPSNPTGTWHSAEEIRQLHAGLPSNVILVVDEAYAEFVTEGAYESAFELARTSDNVVVTRTFSKIHGLGGLRIGYGYAPAEMMAAMDRIRMPFNVSVPGIAAAVAALNDDEHQAASLDLVNEWRPRLTQIIKGFGYEVLPSVTNFILIKFKDEATAAAANAHLMQNGIIVRHVANYGIPDALRLTIGTADQNRAVIDALSGFAAL